MTVPVGGALILGIETSCDETAAAVVDASRVVRSNIVASQAELHAAYGGVFPEMASRQHIRDIWPVVRAAMDQAGVDWQDLAGIAVTRGPGLAGSLLVGVNAAKGLALARGLPLIGVNHMAGHLYSNWLHSAGRIRVPSLARPESEDPGPPFPHLLLTVSGGHTEIWQVRGHGDLERLGGTLDDAAGEAFDKAARMLGLGYPGGPAIEAAARAGDPSAFALPVAETEGRFDFSFSGLKTAVLRQVETIEAAGEPLPVADLAASFQAAVVRALVMRLRRALKAREARAVLVAGGVSANGALREALAAAIDRPLWIPPLALCTDNAAMIAAAGWWAFVGGQRDGMDLDVDPGLRLG
ncbi:MAG: tRNA (adenosine(37)-N6)-threonylcarbamoyltransferase complex transferase subunit TsaD [Caldilineae bacterium]|nr:tRNA (adenosine(37)-N6)-threonylcarbamoyltransferase complex transferase subunit TsaD [Chloroflexota bacterium]MCB9177575.1 tRNA (adenosine(37)-N6)-threonylcarbamoyltransferase complex transferase subunit TsaD [Caldilineae bacterium]